MCPALPIDFSVFLICPFFRQATKFVEILVPISYFEVLNEHLFRWLLNDIKTIVMICESPLRRVISKNAHGVAIAPLSPTSLHYYTVRFQPACDLVGTPCCCLWSCWDSSASPMNRPGRYRRPSPESRPAPNRTTPGTTALHPTMGRRWRNTARTAPTVRDTAFSTLTNLHTVYVIV